jgi:hypothetical protein
VRAPASIALATSLSPTTAQWQKITASSKANRWIGKAALSEPCATAHDQMTWLTAVSNFTERTV